MKSPSHRVVALLSMSVLGLWSMSGCAPRQQPVMMAPPVANGGQMAPPMNNGGIAPAMNAGMAPGQGGVFNWQDVPMNTQVGIRQASFDQGGYQLVTDSGDTIIVPFANQNLYIMRFGRTNGQRYFVNENGVPTLYLSSGQGIANANAQGAMWYPIPNDYNYTRPIYVGLAPSWGEFTNMGWYPGMVTYGGLWGYNPYGFHWMPSYYISIGGNRFTNYGMYRSYYTRTPGYYRPTIVNRSYYNVSPRGTGSYRYTGSYRPSGSTGSFGGTRSTTGSYTPRGTGGFGGANGSTGSFGTGRRTTGTSTGSFGGSSTSGSFGNRTTTPPSGSFGGASGTTGTRGSFGGGSGGFTSRPAPSGGSFGSGSGSFGGARPSTGGSFGGSTSRPSTGSTSRPSGGSSFGSRPSGGSSFGGGTRSSGSFGGGRRR